MSTELENPKERLENQIGDYGALDRPYRELTPLERAELLKGVQKYKDEHQKKVQDYTSQHRLSTASKDVSFFRKLFIEHILKHRISAYEAREPDRRQTNPEEEAVSMEALLGKEGEALYQLALEEELNSDEYRLAVYAKSTEAIDGQQWKQRPVIVVSGPSASGKSTATKIALEKAKAFLPVGTTMTTNHVVHVDGGIAREVSQMRKLAIQVAQNNGYPGIKDLHQQSKALDKAKSYVLTAASKNEALGIVYPETFSAFGKTEDKTKPALEQLMKLSKSRIIFCRVDGFGAQSFKETVAFMGSRRAWKTSNFTPRTLDLNATADTESKAYGGSKSFESGQAGSKAAENHFIKHHREDIRLLVLNDLILIKETTDEPFWTTANKGDRDAFLCSPRTINKWRGAIERGELPPSLKQFTLQNRTNPLVRTSGEIDLNIILTEMANKVKRGSQHKPRIGALRTILEVLLKTDDEGKIEGIQTIEALAVTYPYISTIKDNLEKNFSWSKKWASTSLNLIHRTLKALDKIKKELQLGKTLVDDEVATKEPPVLSADLKQAMTEIRASDPLSTSEIQKFGCS